jgi:riboflavin kinase/FMN adenylyltransferase
MTGDEPSPPLIWRILESALNPASLITFFTSRFPPPASRWSRMNIIRAAGELDPGPRKVCAAIGMFDGVHLGHQQVVRQTIEDARRHEGIAAAITFDCHPNSVVAPERDPPLVYSLPQKLRVIASLGIDTTLLIHFDKEFSEISGEQFIRGLARDFGHIHSLCVGSTFTFGHRRGGNIALLRKLGQELNFIVHGLASVSLDGKAVSSTRIREAIRAGKLDAASQMLGRTYSLGGAVIRGDQFGRRLGFPTANLNVAGLAVPPNGVYAVHALVADRQHRAVANIGLRPTLQNPRPQLQVEVHLLDYSGDLYGRELEIAFVEKLREEEKFPSHDALREQIVRDVEAARSKF